MRTIALIPARMGSSRFPGKPMVLINGKPMIGHVFEAVKECSDLEVVAVATCDDVIRDYIESIGGVAIMTDTKHERASDRCAEALLKIEADMGCVFDCVVMVQGDEPMTKAAMISQALRPLIQDVDVNVTNLSADIRSQEEFEDPNCIKVVCDGAGDAIYFSRLPIPHGSNFKQGAVVPRKQVCVIPFRRDFLLKYNEMPPTPLENSESVDMMRVLENGYKVKMVPTEYQSFAVDVPADRDRVERLMSE